MANEANHIANTLNPGVSLCGMLGEFKLSTEVASPACWMCREALKIQREQRLASGLAALPPGEAAAAKLLYEVFMDWDLQNILEKHGYLDDDPDEGAESDDSEEEPPPTRGEDLCNRIASTLRAAGLLWED